MGALPPLPAVPWAAGSPLGLTPATRTMLPRFDTSYHALRSLQSLLMCLWGQILNPRHSLHSLLRRLCSHTLDPPHSLHSLLMRSWGQMLDPRHSSALALAAVMHAYLRSAAFLAMALSAPVGANARLQKKPCTDS